MLAALSLMLSPGENVGFIGMPGTGKTRSAQQVAAAHPRVLTFDPLARATWDARDRGALCSPWGSELVTYSELVRAPELLDRARFNLAVDPETNSAPLLGKRFSRVQQLAERTGNLLLVEEELARYGAHCIDALLQLATGGRHFGIATMCIAQRYKRLPADARGELNILVAYAQGEPLDVEALRERGGRDFAARVARLKKGDSPCIWRLGDGAASETA